MVAPEAINGAAVPATASQNRSPHPTCKEAGSGQSIITGEEPVPVPGPVAAGSRTHVHGPGASPTLPAASPSASSATSPTMFFSGIYNYKSAKLPLSRLRRSSQPQPVAIKRQYDPDLVSRDKAKQKEAVRRFLLARIRNDWVFNWPPVSDVAATIALEEKPSAEEGAGPNSEATPETQPAIGDDEKLDGSPLDADDDGYHCEDEDAESIYSTVSEDADHFCPRAEWLSDFSGDEGEESVPPSAYRFETPDAVGSAIKASELNRNAKRRRAVRAEMEWNKGLACFNARRDAWTGARVVRVRPKPPSAPTSPTAKRLSFWRFSASSSPSSPNDSPNELSPSATRNSGDITAVSSLESVPKESKPKETSQYPVQTLLPVPPPLLPPENPMRASITPAGYGAIYDKVVVHGLTPACPINLGDVLRSCVVGWKRDGEWPPRLMEAPPVVAVRKKKRDTNAERRTSTGRRLSFNFLGRRLSGGGDPSANPATPRQDDNAAKGVRRSLQKVLGLGHDKTDSVATNH
ncbi:hypothetical protein GGS20DRAFT_310796 [Poronia punctata]|nr:hypothetical protein GGS20DRAFT_310796 [Poronia punctata]